MKKNKSQKLQDEVYSNLYEIAANPYTTGEPKTGDLKEYRAVDFTCVGVSYRILYKIIEDEIVIYIRRIKTRENFYDNL